jgi:enoyl-CoA hydratase
MEPIVREDAGPIAVLRMAHGKVSALDLEFCDALVASINAIARGSQRAMVITGTGTTFSAGVDLLRILREGSDYLKRFLPALERFFRTLLTFPKPATAAVNGHAIAGGCIIAAACDHRVMSAGQARIGVAELAVGVPFPMLPFEIVGARVDRTRFRELVYSGRLVEPAEALGVGFVDEVVQAEELLPRAHAVAERLAAVPPKTFELTKRTFTAPLLARVQASIELNAEVLTTWESPSVQNHIREYLEKTIGKAK